MPLTKWPVLKTILWIALAILPAHAAASVSWQRNGPQGFAARATLSSLTGEIPQPLIVTLELTSPHGYRADFDLLRTNLLHYNNLSAPFHLMKEKAIDERTVEYTLEPLIAGTFPLTFFAITFRDKNSKSNPVTIISDIFEYTATLPEVPKELLNYAAPLLPLNNQLPLQVKGDLRRQLMQATPEMLAQQSVAISSKAIPWLGVAGLLIIGAAYLSIRLFPKQPKKAQITPELSKKTFERAEKLLEKLKGEESQEIAKAYFSALIDAVRYHVEERYNLPAAAQTSDEFLQDVSTAHVLAGENARQLAAFLQICDAVKFGKYKPSPQEFALAYATARQLIGHPKKANTT